MTIEIEEENKRKVGDYTHRITAAAFQHYSIAKLIFHRVAVRLDLGHIVFDGLGHTLKKSRIHAHEHGCTRLA